MTVRVAGNDRVGALETFQSSLAFLSLTTLPVLLLISIGVWRVPWVAWMHLSSLSNHEAATIVLILATYLIVYQQSGVVESGYRCDGKFAFSMAWLASLRLIDNVLVCVVGCLSGSILKAALVFLLSRILGTLGYCFVLRRKNHWIQFGFKYARMERIKKLLAPGLGFVALPLGYALSVQGFTLLIGVLSGPLAVTMFATLRTLARASFPLQTALGGAAWPELSLAFGAGKISLARNIHRRIYQAGAGLSLLMGFCLYVLGPFVYSHWVRQAVPFNATCFHILLVVTFADSLWFTSSMVPISTNSHQQLAFSFLLFSLIAILIAWPLVATIGITGAAVALLLIDVCMIWLVLKTSLKQLQDDMGGFLRAMLKFPRLRVSI